MDWKIRREINSALIPLLLKENEVDKKITYDRLLNLIDKDSAPATLILADESGIGRYKYDGMFYINEDGKRLGMCGLALSNIYEVRERL